MMHLTTLQAVLVVKTSFVKRGRRLLWSGPPVLPASGHVCRSCCDNTVTISQLFVGRM